MKEIGFECRNAKKFPRSLCSLAYMYIDYLDIQSFFYRHKAMLSLFYDIVL